MTKTKIAIFAITTILLSAAMMTQEVYAPDEEPQKLTIGGTGYDKAIPDWVDQNFRWYAQELISQTELINSLEFLVTERIILLPSVVQTAEGQEITQSIEELQQRIDILESYDESEAYAIIEKLEKQIEIFEGGPQALGVLEPDELEKDDCGPKPGPGSHPSAVIAYLMCKSISDISMLEKETFDEENEKQLQFQALDEEIKKAQMIELDETPSIPAGATGTYVNYKKGTPENYRLTVECDSGDVATGGGFAPAIKFGFEQDYLASMPYPTNWANNPRMNNPTGWTYMTMDGSEARVWVVCLDLTPSSLTPSTAP